MIDVAIWPSRAFFLIGAPRCGTNALSLALAQHPQVCFSEPREPHYFSRLSGEVDLARLEREYIRSFFRQERLSRAILAEGSCSYLYSPTALRTIDRMFPGARFLVMVRNPLDMLPSYHARCVFTLDEDVTEFEEAWRLQGRRAQGQSIPPRCRDARMLQYAEIGRVGARLADLIDLVGRDRVNVVVMEDFALSPRAVYREVLKFLELPDDGRTDFPRRNGTKAYRSQTIQRLLMRPPRLARSLVAPQTVGPSHPGTVGRLIKRLRQANIVRTRWQPLGLPMRRELADCLRDDVELLGRLLNRDFREWLDDKAPPVVATSHDRGLAPAALGRVARSE